METTLAIDVNWLENDPSQVTPRDKFIPRLATDTQSEECAEHEPYILRDAHRQTYGAHTEQARISEPVYTRSNAIAAP